MKLVENRPGTVHNGLNRDDELRDQLEIVAREMQSTREALQRVLSVHDMNAELSGRLTSALREVTPDSEIVWEHVNPHNLAERDGLFWSDVFRAYRYPYDWVPQIDPPRERAVIPPAHGEFRIQPVD